MATPAGKAHFYLFPFDIHRTKEEFPPIPLVLDGHRGTVYGPFQNRKTEVPPIAQVDLSRVPRRPFTTQPQGGPSVTITPQVPADRIRADAVRVDVYGDEVAGRNAADAFVGRFLRLIRAATNQWWITRPHAEYESNPRNTMDINGRGERIQTNQSMALSMRIEATMGVEDTLLSSELFAALARNAGEGCDSPLSLDLYFDAVFTSISDQQDELAVLLVAMACELAVREGLSRALSRSGNPRRRVIRLISSSDLLRNLRVVAPLQLRRDFFQEEPDSGEWITRLWKERGRLAHGNLNQRAVGSSKSSLEREQVAAVLGAARTLMKWADTLSAADPEETSYSLHR